ncbi:MAG: hypothetical protein WAM79_10685 [Candidatus Sulfotelmatobacter sp.]
MSPLAARQSPSETSAFFQVVDAFDDGFSYAYSPSIILKDGTYHVFFCSEGGGNYPSWDAIRYTTSTDGETWSRPKVVLQATAKNGEDMAACDPSLVFYQGFYYLYYTSALTTASKTYQGVIQVARSVSIDGPYLTFTQRRTWENTPTDPNVLIYPLEMHCAQPSGYGAGQQSVIVQNGQLLMWYTDDSVFVSGQPQVKTYMLQSSDPVAWAPEGTHATNLVNQASIDVKFDLSQSQFMMIRVENEFSSTSYLARSYSSDGMSWTAPQAVYPSGQFPQYAHDAGIAGDEIGNVASPSALVGFGVPYGLADADNWGHWDLYAGYVDPP